MKLLLLALGVSVIFAGWQWFRPYDWSPDPGARFTVKQCMVERDHSNLWLRVFLKPRKGQAMDYLKPIHLKTSAGKQLELANFVQSGAASAEEAANPEDQGSVDELVFSFWLEPADFAGPLKLEMNDGSLLIRSGDTLPRVADGGVRIFNSTRW